MVEISSLTAIGARVETQATAPAGPRTHEPEKPVPPAPVVSPRTEIDPALNVVVLAFFDGSGALSRSIPTQTQLESYRLHGLPKDAG